jgi:hypothetical protein
MATTTNYAWETPDDTDLVKDGAAAIRTLGSSIDTTTKALNPSTTLGDIEYRSSTANTNTRLGIGSTGNVLTVAGGVPTWAAPAGGGKVLQVVADTTRTSTTIATTTFTDTGLSASITPTSASSKVLVLVTQAYELFRANNTVQAGSILKRGATTVWDGDETNRYSLPSLLTNASMSSFQWSGQVVVSYLDSPATTSSTTYKMQMAVENTTNSQQIATNKNVTSTIILLEIGA